MPQEDKMHFQHVTLTQDQFYLSQHLHTHKNCTFIIFFRSASFGVFMQHDEENLIPLRQKSPGINNFFSYTDEYIREQIAPKKLYKRQHWGVARYEVKGWAVDDANGDILQHLLHFNYVKQWYFMWWFFRDKELLSVINWQAHVMMQHLN
jgi:hypothetical protein